MKALLRRFLERADENLDCGQRHLELATAPRARGGLWDCCSHCPRPCWDVHTVGCPDCQSRAA